MADNLPVLRHPRCTCGKDDVQLGIDTMRLCEVSTQSTMINSELLGLCRNQGVVALVMSASSILHMAGCERDEIRERIVQALDVVLTAREQMLAMQDDDHATKH